MQTPLFTITTPSVGRLPDGHMVTKAYPHNGYKQAALAKTVDRNGKRDWVIWTRVWNHDKSEWRYYDGLEFGTRAEIAHQEYERRKEAIRGSS